MKLFGKGKKSGEVGKKSKKTRVIIIVVIVIVLFLLLKGCSGGEVTTMVTTAYAEKGELQESVSTSGTVQAENGLQKSVIYICILALQRAEFISLKADSSFVM